MKIMRATFPETRVLVVDDYLVNQKVAQTMLERLGCQVDIASDGRQVAELHRDNQYHIIFMDVQMQEIDGYQATKAVRREESRGKKTPIIAITANALDGDKEKCLKAGMNDYIAKPVRLEHFEHMLTRFLPDRAKQV